METQRSIRRQLSMGLPWQGVNDARHKGNRRPRFRPPENLAIGPAIARQLGAVVHGTCLIAARAGPSFARIRFANPQVFCWVARKKRQPGFPLGRSRAAVDVALRTGRCDCLDKPRDRRALRSRWWLSPRTTRRRSTVYTTSLAYITRIQLTTSFHNRLMAAGPHCQWTPAAWDSPSCCVRTNRTCIIIRPRSCPAISTDFFGPAAVSAGVVKTTEQRKRFAQVGLRG